MKLKFRGGIGIMTAILFAYGCSNEDAMNDINPPDTPSASVESVQLRGIRNYIASNRKSTRGLEADIHPYIDEDGDTLMYIADYGEGWELFSNSLTAPMSLIKSDEGNFSTSIENISPAFYEIYKDILEALKVDKKKADSQCNDCSRQWELYASVPTPKPDPGSDKVKTLVGTKIYSEEELHIPHMLTTKWRQVYPYNQYMPKDFTNSESKGHIYVGCTAVATGQLLYYSHYKWGKPNLAPSVAIYNESANKYEFSQFTSLQWDKMYLVTPLGDADSSVGMYLGWIAQGINSKAHYEDGTHDMTTATISNAANFVKQQTGYTTSVKIYDRHDISTMIKNGKPVILSLSISDRDAGHMVVIDAMDFHEINYINYYAYLSSGGTTDPVPTPGSPSTSTDPYYDELVAQYGEITSEATSYSSSYFKFNWGLAGSLDDNCYINGDIFTFILHTLDGDMTFKLNRYIDYDVK